LIRPYERLTSLSIIYFNHSHGNFETLIVILLNAAEDRVQAGFRLVAYTSTSTKFTILRFFFFTFFGFFTGGNVVANINIVSTLSKTASLKSLTPKQKNYIMVAVLLVIRCLANVAQANSTPARVCKARLYVRSR